MFLDEDNIDLGAIGVNRAWYSDRSLSTSLCSSNAISNPQTMPPRIWLSAVRGFKIRPPMVVLSTPIQGRIVMREVASVLNKRKKQ